MKVLIVVAIFTRSAKVVTVVLSAAWLLNGYPAMAGQVSGRLTPARASEFYSDLVRNDSLDFFRLGNERFEREIQLFNQKRFTSKTPLLKIRQMPQIQDSSLGNGPSPQ
jgi:hypothetical protein